jgi:hypothetical protein
MTIKQALGFVAAASALVAGLASTASAKDCQPVITTCNTASGCQCTSTTANAFGKASVSSGGNTDTWTYSMNFAAGPVFPTRSVSLINSDGVNFTINRLSPSSSRCPPVLDGAQPPDGNFGSPQVCVTNRAGQAGAPRFLRISIPGN